MRISYFSTNGNTLLIFSLFLVSSIYPTLYLVSVIMNGFPPYSDAFALWTFGRFLHVGHAADIYNDKILFAFQDALEIPASGPHYPFRYPPLFLLVLKPLGYLSFHQACLIWIGGSFSLYLGALRIWMWPRLYAATLIMAPASLLCVAAGQNGFLSAALFLGCLQAMPARPVIAGMCLGALAYKPQLCIILPFFMLFSRHYKILGTAFVTACILALFTIFIFGPDIWSAWLHNMQGQVIALSEGHSRKLALMPTITASLINIGVSESSLHIFQIFFYIIGVYIAWHLKSSNDTQTAIALAMTTLVVTPYAFAYDLPMVAGAILVMLASNDRLNKPVSLAYLTILLGAFITPIFYLSNNWIFSLAPLFMMLTTILYILSKKSGIESPSI